MKTEIGVDTLLQKDIEAGDGFKKIQSDSKV